MDPQVTYAVEAVGRDLRVPTDTYEVVPLSELGSSVVESVVDDEATLVRRITEYETWIDNDFYILLPVAGPWSILDVGGELRGVCASEHAGRWFVALSPSAGALATSFVLGDGSSWHGDAWRLRPHPLVEPAGRDWRWRGGGSSGPHTITVVVDAPDELPAFWTTCAPVVYGDEDGALGVARADQFVVAGNRFSIRRSYARSAEIHLAAFDRGVLLALARGAAGDVHWWLAMEHDWYTPYAI